MSQVIDVIPDGSDEGVSPNREIPPIARRIRYGQVVSAAVVIVLATAAILSLVRNEELKWSVIGHYLFQARVLDGLKLTLELTAISMGAALVLAVIIANMRLSSNRVLRSVSWVFVWFFRGVPLLVLLVLMYNFSLLYPKLALGFPGLGSIWSAPTHELMSPFWAAVVAFVLNQSVFTSETIRASIQAIPAGQTEAAHSLGMTGWRTFRRIVLPQAMRIAIPPVANDAINLLKATALVAFIAVSDLLYSVQQIYASNYQIIPLLIVATIWYVVIVSIMSVGQWALERRFGRGVSRLGVAMKAAGGKTR